MIKGEIPFNPIGPGFRCELDDICSICGESDPYTYGSIVLVIEGRKIHSTCHAKEIQRALSEISRKISKHADSVYYHTRKRALDEKFFPEMEKLMVELKEWNGKLNEMFNFKHYKICTGYYSKDEYVEGARHIRLYRLSDTGKFSYTETFDFNIKEGKAGLTARLFVKHEKLNTVKKELLKVALKYSEEWEKGEGQEIDY
jgi:hypothetical protein